MKTDRAQQAALWRISSVDDKTFGKDFMERRYKLGAKWKQFKAQTTLRADGRENTLQNVEKADLYREFKPADKYLADAEMKVYMRKKLDDASKTTTRGENLEAGFGGAFSNAYPLAKKYVYREYSNIRRFKDGIISKRFNIIRKSCC